jgi:hypothetical protein
MTQQSCRPPTRRGQLHRHLGGARQRGAATAELAVGVLAAVLIAGLLVHLLLSGFFDVLLQSLFEQGLDLAVDLVAATMSRSLPDISPRAWTGPSAVTGETPGWAWVTVVHTWNTVASGAVSASRATASGAATIAEATLDAAASALRWAGGPVSSALPW